MKYSKQTTRFVDLLVHSHAKYDRLAEQYVLSVDDLADFDLEKLAALIMSDHPDCASEATGPDNLSYEISMLPALTIFLRDRFNKDAQANFIERWQLGIVKYLRPHMEDLLESSLSDYNHEVAA